MPADRAGLLLDTHAMIWLLAGDERLSTRARAATLAADRLVVSTVSLWEAAIKRSLGKLRAPSDLSRRLTALHQIELLPIFPPHAEAVGELPWHHRDPFDRLLVAQARAEGLAIASSDPALAQYGVEIVW
ncbi:MAG TPA: type II toxin-antitoxin system VapC family toxin [Conexibacter sp.]|nr:type II toxin-antitoxin system VapC family toxin [Conexibacter sp.]